MKVGILTQHFLCNYGGILQNYALQQVLEEMGHEQLTFEHDTCYSRTRWLFRATKQILKNKSVNKLPEFPYKGRIGHKRFIHFIINRLNSVTVREFTSDLERRYGIDAFIVGSDQVWRPAFNIGRLYNMFLDFASDGCRKIAYAASFGVSDWEYTEEETRRCRDLARRFDAISVREDSGVALCKEHLGVNAIQVLDPTLLLNMEDYSDVCRIIPQSQPHVFVYSLVEEGRAMAIANTIAQKQNVDVIAKRAGNNLRPTDSIEGWIASFRDASFVVTDSFHGMAFSIIFNKPFLIVKNESGGNARYHSLLKQLGLEQRIVDDPDNLPSDIIDWKMVNEKRELLRQASLKFLNDSLK